ncbi:MAG TPA: DUF4214 domain-containing protein [Noviherbaspirillum sp.]|uniref:beta strand repeat-containing protein n=1 Tax=Noviherbaspirillum sp. TaxID=1926288 RepID=UPI002B471C3A|nr:DUF4214 domain-containing protein [Noviherbaspirillum sp.]HJV84308.1 DUF4214 domain-containing protein [Noviherbaspirillum sp.]
MAATEYYQVVQQIYVSYFGRPADPVGLANFASQLDAAGAPKTLKDIDAAYASNTTIKTLIDQFGSSTESNTLYAGASTAAFVNAIYSNILNRAADFDGLIFWSSAIDRGVITRAKAALSIMSGALNDTSAQGVIDGQVVANKIAVAANFTTNLNTSAEVVSYAGDAAAASARAMLTSVTNTTNTTTFDVDSTISQIGNIVVPGTTFTLTTGVDTLTGTAGNDTFNAVIDAGPGGAIPPSTTWTALDVIDGGAGTDTLKINAITDFAVPGSATVTNVENVTIAAAAKLGTFTANGTGNVDLSTVFGTVNNLTITSASEADFKAGTSTAVNVSGVTGGLEVVGGSAQTVSLAAQGGAVKLSGSTGAISLTSAKHGANNIDIDGGSTVNVTTTSTVSNGNTAIGANTAATGAVTVTQNLNSDGTAALNGGTIGVTGGTSVNVTVNAVSTAKDENADSDITIGAITVTGNGKTTAVTVDQNKTETTFTKAAVPVVKETSVVTFGAMKSGEALTINGLTFTAAKDLTAEQAAQAFSNLTAADTQSASGPVANGIYTGAFNSAVWTSAAASGKTVTFTAKDDDETDLTFTGTATTNDAGARIPTQVKTAGTVAVAKDTSTNVVTYSDVRIDDAATAAITTVTVDGYKSADIGATGNDLNALKTLSLANSAGTASVATSATTLDLTVNKVKHAVDLDQTGATIATLNVTTTGANSAFALTSAATKDLTVAGDKAVDLTGSTLTALENVTVTGSAGLNLGASVAAKSINTTGTTGTVTATIDGNAATYTGGAGVDKVTLNNTTVSKAIDLGDGDDTLTLASGTSALTSDVNGGGGTDTLVMTAADAATLSGSTAFATKIAGFDKLSLTQETTTKTVDMSNMDGINYVISSGSAGGTGANTTYATTKSLLTNGDTFAFTYNGAAKTATIGATAGATATAAEVQAAVDAQVGAGKVTASFSGNDLVLTAVGDPAHDTLTGGNYTNAGGTRSTLDGADTAGTAYSTKWAGQAAALTQNDTIAFTYDGTAKTATIGATAGASATAAEIQAAVDAQIGAGKVTASFTNGGADLTFTANAPYHTLVGGNYTDADHVGGAATVAAADTAGAAANSVYAAEVALLTKGDTIAFTYNGTVYTATIGTTAGATATDVEVNAAIDAAVTAGNVALGANKVTASFTNAGADLTLTSDDASKALVGGNFTDVGGTYATTAGANAAATDTTLTLTKVADNSTLELTGAGTGVIVTMADATGSADTLNIVTKVSTADLNFGTVTTTNVETIHLTVTDTLLDNNADGVNDPVSASTVTLKDAALTTVTVTGNGNVTLNLDANVVALTSVDASGLTGALTATTNGTVAQTIKGGSGDDVLTSKATGSVADQLFGGDGMDTLVANKGMSQMTGGAGHDIFQINVASLNVNSASTIMDLGSGDVIKFANADAFKSAAVTLDSTAVFQDFANAAIATITSDNDLAWFQYGGNTYIVQEKFGGTGNHDTFLNNQDFIVKIVGTVDLSTASFNATAGTLEIA